MESTGGAAIPYLGAKLPVLIQFYHELQILTPVILRVLTAMKKITTLNKAMGIKTLETPIKILK